MAHIFSVLGVVTGTVTIISVTLLYWITLMTMWKLCLRFPETRSVYVLGRIVFSFKNNASYWITGSLCVVQAVVLQKHVSRGLECPKAVKDFAPCCHRRQLRYRSSWHPFHDNEQHSSIEQGGEYFDNRNDDFNYIKCGFPPYGCPAQGEWRN